MGQLGGRYYKNRIGEEKGKLLGWLFSALSVYLIAAVAMVQYWYGKDGYSEFHWFDDSTQWQGMDKLGHFFSVFHLSRIFYDALRVEGFEPRKYLWHTVIMVFLMVSWFEVMDGLSPTYGASVADLVANFLGGAAFATQILIWGKVTIWPRYSFFPTQWATLRPNTLGEGYAQEMLKDYNGQTNWYLLNLQDVGIRWWPKNLMLALGYGANNMLYGNPDHNREHGQEAYGEFYFTLSPQWENYLTGLKGHWGYFLIPLQLLMLPLPALKLTSTGQWRLTFVWLWEGD